MLFPPSAVERAMQIKEVLLPAMSTEYRWLRAAEILGITPRGLRRLRQRMEEFGYQGLVDMRCGRPSPRRTGPLFSSALHPIEGPELLLSPAEGEAERKNGVL